MISGSLDNINVLRLQKKIKADIDALQSYICGANALKQSIDDYLESLLKRKVISKYQTISLIDPLKFETRISYFYTEACTNSSLRGNTDPAIEPNTKGWWEPVGIEKEDPPEEAEIDFMDLLASIK